MRARILVVSATFLVLVATFQVTAAAPGDPSEVPASKLRGGMAEMIAARSMFDQRVEYLLEGYRPGELVYFVMLDGQPSAGRRAALQQLGAQVRWQFEAIDAYSLRSMPGAALEIASLSWVDYLYPVRSYVRHATSSQPISGTITRETTPQVHELGNARHVIPMNTRAITVDLTVDPPVNPTFDFNAQDYPQATLYRHQKPMATQPAQGDQMSFQYDEGGAVLPRRGWTLVIEYRNANNPPPATTVYSYDGAVEYNTEADPIDPEPIAEGECSGPADQAAWRQNENLPKRSVTDMGAPTLWEEGIIGSGVRLAITDTGVDETHTDLDDLDWEHWGQAGCPSKVIAQAYFAGGEQHPNNPDTDGHGTHVAGEAAGTAEAAGPGTYPGVAPGASLIDAQIAQAFTGLNDDIMAGLEWAIVEQQADVLNLSFGIDIRFGSLNDERDPQSIQANALLTNPAWGFPTMAVAAGNSGDIFDSVGVPASASQVLAVAASIKDWDAVMPPSGGECSTDQEGVPDEQDQIHPSTVVFSSRGPSQDLLLKPNITAPGRRIQAAESNSKADGDPEPNSYWCISGTSMASPHAAGAAALIVDAYRQAFGTSGPFDNRPPHWLVKAALMNTVGTFADRPADLEIPPNAAGETISYGPSEETNGVVQLFGDEDSRESHTPDTIPDPVGSLVEGAGRVNLPAAVQAITQGVVIYSDPALRPFTFAGQAQFDAGRIEPGFEVSRPFLLDPATGGPYEVRFTANPGAPSREVTPIPNDWLVLPGDKVVSGSGLAVPFGLRVPDDAEPGYYSTYIFARVTGPSRFRQTLRIPVFAVVESRDLVGTPGVSAQGDFEGKILALQPSTFPGNPGLFTGASSDYPLFPFEVHADETIVIRTWQTITSTDELDLFVYGDDSIVIAHTYDEVPGPPTIEAAPAVLVLEGLDPGDYLVAVNNTYPECPELTCDWFELPYKIEIDRVMT